MSTRLELRVDLEKPLAFLEHTNGRPPKLVQNGCAILCQPRVLGLDVGHVITVFHPNHALMHDAACAIILPKVEALDELMGDPHGVMMAVTLRIARMSNACKRPTTRTDYRKDVWPLSIVAKVVPRDLHPVALERHLVMSLRDRLDSWDRLWLSDHEKRSAVEKNKHHAPSGKDHEH
jgi:hypothetical protein